MQANILLLICGITEFVSAQYYYNKPDIEFNTGINLDIKREGGYHYPKPKEPFKLPTPTTIAPYEPQKPLTNVKKEHIPSKPSKVASVGYNYPKPNRPFIIPDAIISEKKENVVPHNIGYQYTKPKQQFILPTPSIIKKEPQPQKKISQGYQYPKPQTAFDLPSKLVTPIEREAVIIPRPSGYQYARPANPLVLPSATPTIKPGTEEFKVVIHTTTTEKTQVHLTTPRAEQVASAGYNYPTPKNPLVLPTRPSKEKPTHHGYDYQQPLIPFREVPSSVTPPSTKSNIFSGYQYPKPLIPFEPLQTNEIPEEPSLGYRYPRPSIPFVY